jgi:glucosyl-3-phosphoglycerate synthase
VEFENVPSFAHTLDAWIELDGFGKVRVDVAYGGMFYAIVDAARFDLELVPKEAHRISDLGERVRLACREQLEIVHPGNPAIRGVSIVQFAGPFRGKGEALWKGVAASSGDLIAFVDADIHDIDPRFVVGLLGPLLHDPAVIFTKATYDRPFKREDRIEPTGGGRVTELLARPLLATFWPELTWLAQPLSGEYAGRRDLLESLPFVQGYGVELAMLVDIADGPGVDVIAQVDLGQRVHEHQPLANLSRMAAEILHVAMNRLARQGRLVLTDSLATTLLQPVRDADGSLRLSAHEVAPTERPPQRRGDSPYRAVPSIGPA